MTDRNRRGILSYQAKPAPSSNFVLKKFVTTVVDTEKELSAFFAYGRWWRINPTDYSVLQYTILGLPTPDFSDWVQVGGFLTQNNGAIDFIEDSDDPIRLVAADGDGRVFVIKKSCGYVLSSANQDPSVWRKSAPEFGVGTIHEGPSFTNSIFGKDIALIWNSNGETKNRHYLWSGSGAAVELSEDIRELAGSDEQTTTASINWSQQLVIFGNIVYDINARRIFNYTGSATASYTSRPFYQPMYNMLTIYRLAFITDGKSGSFDAEIEYGQSADNLQKTKAFKVRINDTTKVRFRHVWNIDIPVVCRVWRIKITNLSGCSISQIDADVGVNKSPDFEESA